jgi:uncharacterized protein (DUF433 family)
MSTPIEQRITLEPGKRGGKACVRGLRITVQDVLDWLAAGQSEAQILEEYPELSIEDIRAVLMYAADRERHVAWIPVAA